MPGDAFDRLIAPLQKRMVDCVWRICRDGAETEDIMQDVLVQVWERFDEVERHPNPTAFVLRVCTHRALDRLRRRRSRSTVLESFADHPPAAAALPTPAEQIDRREQREEIRAFLGALAPREAEAMALLALEELAPEEIAAAMGCSAATVRVLIGRARKRFRATFDLSSFH